MYTINEQYHMEPHGIHLSSKADLTVKWKSINKTNSLDRQMHY